MLLQVCPCVPDQVKVWSLLSSCFSLFTTTQDFSGLTSRYRSVSITAQAGYTLWSDLHLTSETLVLGSPPRVRSGLMDRIGNVGLKSLLRNPPQALVSGGIFLPPSLLYSRGSCRHRKWVADVQSLRGGGSCLHRLCGLGDQVPGGWDGGLLWG